MQSIIRFIHKNSIFLPPIFLLGIFIILLGLILRIQTKGSDRLSKEQGLAPIKVIQIVDGKEQELNITDTTFEILKEAITSSSRFDTVTEQKIDQIQIKDIIFPPIPEDQIQIVDKSDTEAIEKYLSDVYTVFITNKVDFQIESLVQESLEAKTDHIQSLIATNTNLYNQLFEISVPEPVLPLHRKYIQITQIQNHFLTNLLSTEDDPLKIQIDLNLALSLLTKLNDPIKQDLKNLSNTYDLEYNVDI